LRLSRYGFAPIVLAAFLAHLFESYSFFTLIIDANQASTFLSAWNITIPVLPQNMQMKLLTFKGINWLD
jgi:hypothetical protein